MKPPFLLLPIFASLYISPSSSSPTSSTNDTSTTCPLDLSYVQTLPWHSTDCQNFNISTLQLSNNSNNSTLGEPKCCQTLLSLYGIALAQHLKTTSFFHLPTSISCLSYFQSKLDLSLYPPISPPSALTLSNLTDLTSCDSCVAAGFQVQAELIIIDGNKSHSINCLYFTILYAAGIINEFGPNSTGSITCILNLPLGSQMGSSRNKHLALVLGLSGAGVVVLQIISLLGLYFLWYKKWRKKRDDQRELGSRRARTMIRPNMGSKWFTIHELKKATKNFSSTNLIGRGSFRVVYKGTLADGSMIAVKQLIESDFQGIDEFYNEVDILSNLKHRNLVPLRGCCCSVSNYEDENNVPYEEIGQIQYLVYDYMPNGNLNDHLDIKATNILLDGEMRARVADFGLAKESREGKSHLTTSKVAGTHGYLAPEYALYGHFSEKSDVYSFGLVVLEMMCGRKALGGGDFDLNLSKGSLVRTLVLTDWCWSLVKAGKMEEALDSSLLRKIGGGDEASANVKAVAERFLAVGVLCAHAMVSVRPTILDAIKMLEGDVEVPTVPERPTPLVEN
ncbi:hypothetical protein TEA_002091 [Camellia sinensis var. sinensis]|uniref:non-specific serine/threonine protein kinase n=1 Tax=Camellia sinensis var. sinensis TaxID=542762 RepID=A0A4S4E4F8_CAMSN|nr:hypothetical protein TEA_002091 [Camellia sinensis var. sinensis]